VIDPRTLRGQLALAYAAALLVALIAFAALALFLVDREQRTALDERLETARRAVTALLDVQHGQIVIDAKDASQFGRILGARIDGAILDASGGSVASSSQNVPPELVALAARADVPALATVKTAESTVRVAAAPLRGHRRRAGAIVVWREVDEIDDLDRRLAILFALAIPLVAVFAVLGGSAVAARGLRPLNEMAALASEIEAHDLSRRLPPTRRDDELGRLYATFDRMLDRLEAAFARQRRFTGDASHELRAPLSVIRAEADLALRRARGREEYERALRTIAAQADYLEAVTRDLLAAARAESAAGAPQGAIDVAAVARAAAARLEPLARARGVALTIAASGDAPARAEARSLERALVTLLHNAIKFARAAVRIAVERADAAVRITVSDDGPGFSAEALAHATERFWRDDPARSHDAPAESGESSGAGLGLAIAASIAESFGGTLALSNAPGGGAAVVLELHA
jgi:signal transduction histidine kinase